MREIKYRAWIKKEKKIEDVDFINFAAQFAGKWECKKPDADLFSDRGDEVATRRGRLFNLEDVEILQYTGLKDKNGKEIYEGDIIRVTRKFESGKLIEKPYLTVVKYSKGFYCLKNFERDYEELFQDNETVSYEVVGNIYENKEF